MISQFKGITYNHFYHLCDLNLHIYSLWTVVRTVLVQFIFTIQVWIHNCCFPILNHYNKTNLATIVITTLLSPG